MGFKSILQDIGIGSNAAIGPDFDPKDDVHTIRLNERRRGSKAWPRKIYRTCRLALGPGGVGTECRAGRCDPRSNHSAEIDATLEQFSNIKNVVVLTQSGHCFGDESGLDRCL